MFCCFILLVFCFHSLSHLFLIVYMSSLQSGMFWILKFKTLLNFFCLFKFLCWHKFMYPLFCYFYYAFILTWKFMSLFSFTGILYLKKINSDRKYYRKQKANGKWDDLTVLKLFWESLSTEIRKTKQASCWKSDGVVSPARPRIRISVTVKLVLERLRYPFHRFTAEDVGTRIIKDSNYNRSFYALNHFTRNFGFDLKSSETFALLHNIKFCRFEPSLKRIV